MTIKNITILIITFLLFWSGVVIADILVEDSFIFECEGCPSLGEEVLKFLRIGSLKIYTITVDSGGNFSINQDDVSKFKIDFSGNVSWVGNLSDGDFDLKAVLASKDCTSGYAYGIDSDGLRCVKDCTDSNCGLYGVNGNDRVCEYKTDDGDCGKCWTCNGTSLTCTVNDGDSRCSLPCSSCNADHNCVNAAAGTQVSGCDSTCKACYYGECKNASLNSDPGNRCGTSLCYTGLCNGVGACAAYNDGAKHGCSSCKFCNDADVQCELRPGYYYDSSCGSCQMCDYIGNCVQSSGTHWNKNLFGCFGSTSRCYGGVCRTCGGKLRNDNCYGCAKQGGLACWYTGGDPGASTGFSCNTVCGSVRGCVAANWNDDSSCSICKEYSTTAPCENYWAYGFVPAYYNLLGQNTCIGRAAATAQNCGLRTSEWYSRRFCVCNW